MVWELIPFLYCPKENKREIQGVKVVHVVLHCEKANFVKSLFIYLRIFCV